MASHAKRPKIGDGPEMNPLPDFLQWCKTVGLVLCDKVRVSKEGTVAEFGMLATDNIEEGEVLFTVPRSALLHQDTTEVSVLLEKERSSLQSPSGWVPLLLALLYEYTSPQSRWRPYLSLWTDFKTLDHPMFWSKEERDRLLRATGVPEAVDADLANIDSLRWFACGRYAGGEEVFNTYGQMANWQLLHMYGFTEPHRDNRDDTADIPVGNFCKVAAQGVQSGLEQQLVEEKQEVLCQVMRGKEAFVFGKQGCLTDSELHSALKVLCMSEEEFSEFKDNEGWEEDEDEDISLSFSNEGLSGLKASWKWLIHGAARLTLRSYGEEAPGVKSDQELMEDRVAFAGPEQQAADALQVRCGQKSILHRLMELTGS
ncbi:LOW QUALITY PROTEIN: N-lysine methyltransferase setd6-like [Gasterosteus aculeatus]